MDKLSIDYSFLSDDFVFKEILLKLPAKSLMRFKAVSKSWLAHISNDSTFAADHLRLHYPNAVEFSHIIRAAYSHEVKVMPKLFFLGRDTSKLVEIDTSKTSLKVPFFRIIGSANGLVLLRQYNFRSTELMLCNPVTGEFNHLPAPTLPKVCSRCGDRPVEYFIRFDKESNDYKIVRLQESVMTKEEDKIFGETVIDVQLFTKSSGSWRQLKGFHGFNLLWACEQGWVVDGAIHWSIIKGGKIPAKSSLFSVLSFDIHSEEFRELDGPVCPDDDEYDHLQLIKWKGSLGALMSKSELRECQFWLKTKNVWTKMSIVEPNIPSWSFGCVFRDQLVVLDRDQQKEFSYDFVSKKITEFKDDLENINFLEVFNYVPNSLVSPYY